MPRFPKGSAEAKEAMKLVRERRNCVNIKTFQSESGKTLTKKSYTSTKKNHETLPNGDKVVKTTAKKMSTKPTPKQKQNNITINLEGLGENIAINPAPIPEPEPPVAEIQPTKRPRQKYTTDEERRQAKREQTLASNKRKREERRQAKLALEGSGMIEDIQKGLKKAGRATKKIITQGADIIKTGATNIGKTLQQGAEAVADYGKAVVYGRGDEYPPKVRKILKKYGGEVITGLTIMRTPVPDILTKVLSVFSGGSFGENLKKSPYDTLFHLFLEMQTESGVRISVEKNEVINMDVRPKKRDQTETKVVDNVPQGITIQQMLDKTKERMGDRYFKYSARDNNCQDYIVAIFKANGFGNQSDIEFIKQDTKQLFNDLPYLRKIANTVTDIAGRANVIATGRGVKSEYQKRKEKALQELGKPSEYEPNYYQTQSVIFRDDKWTVARAKKWLKDNEYIVPKVDKTENYLRFRQITPEFAEAQGLTEYRTKELGDGSGISLILVYRKNKMSRKNIKKMKGRGAIPTQVLVEQEHGKPMMTGGAVCSMCGEHMMTGGKIKMPKVKVPKALKKLGSDIEKGFKKEITKPTSKLIGDVGDYVTAKKGGLASDVVQYGIPAATSALLGGLATAATGGNPVAGVAGSALGAKLGKEVIAKEVQKASGTGVRKGRFAKGSQEAKDYMKMLREKRGK